MTITLKNIVVLALLHQVRYTGYRDRPLHERQAKFQHALRDGNVELVSQGLQVLDSLLLILFLF